MGGLSIPCWIDSGILNLLVKGLDKTSRVILIYRTNQKLNEWGENELNIPPHCSDYNT